MDNSGTIVDVVRRGIVPRRHHDPLWPIESRLVAYSCVAEKDAESPGPGVLPLLSLEDGTYEDESGWLKWTAEYRARGTIGIQLSSVVDYTPKPCPQSGRQPPPPQTGTRTRPRAARTSTYNPANAGAPGTGTTAPTGTTTTTTRPQPVSPEAVGLLPLRRSSEPDTRFDKKALTGLPSFAGSYPVGWTGTLAAGTEEYTQEEIFHPDFLGVVAVNDNGDPAAGTRFFDLGADGAVNPNLSREAQSLVAVLDLGLGACGVGGKTIALQLGKGGRKDGGAGYHVFVDYNLTSSGNQAQPPPPPPPTQQTNLLGTGTTRTRPKTSVPTAQGQPPGTRTRPGGSGGAAGAVQGQVGIGAHYGGGPFRIEDCTQHKLAVTAQGMDLRPVHLSSQSLWILKGIGDAPFAWDDTRFIPPAPDGPYWANTYLRHDPARGHTVCNGSYSGLFAWQTPVPFYIPDPPPCIVDLQSKGSGSAPTPQLPSFNGAGGQSGRAANAPGGTGSLPGQPATGTGSLPGQPATGTGSLPGGVRVDRVKDLIDQLGGDLSGTGQSGAERSRTRELVERLGDGLEGDTQQGETGETTSTPPGKKPPTTTPPIIGQPHWPAYVFGHQCQFGPGYGYKPYATNDGEYALPGARCSPREIGGSELQEKFEEAPTCISISGYAKGDGTWCGFTDKVQLDDGWYTGTGGAVVHNPAVCVKEMVERLDDLSAPVKSDTVGNLVIEGTSACLAFSKPSNKSSTGVSGGFALEQSTASGSGLTGAALDADGLPITDAGFDVGSATFEIKQAIDLEARDLVLRHAPHTAGTNPVPGTKVGLVVGDGNAPHFNGFSANTLLISKLGVLSAIGGGTPTVQNLQHHAYPFGVRRDTDHVPGHPSFVDDETLLHYPGWTIAENDASSEFHAFTFAEERDATSSQRTSYCQVAVSTEEGVAVELNFRTQIPETFSGWGANGIVLLHRIFCGAGAGAAGDTATITLEVFDPTTVADTAEITVLRVKTAAAADDAGYVALTATKAQLDGMSNTFGAGDMLHVKVELFGVFGVGAHQPTFRLGRLSAHFAGPTWLAP